MNIARFFTSIPSWALFALVVLICVLAAEAGAWMAERRGKKGIKEPDSPIGTAVGAILGLLAFMLGFTFSFTESRYGERKELVIEQANAISSCYLRSNLIPEKQKAPIRQYLREYLKILLQENLKAYGPNSNRNIQASIQGIAQLEALHALMWQQASTLTKEDMDSEIRTFFLDSLNDVINIYQERKTVSLIFRIPDVLWSSLILLSLLGTFVVGYQTGTFGTRRIVSIPLMAAAFALVIAMIADMDSTGPNRFEISQQPLIEVQQMMKKDSP
ncbi:bestrophin-like domain [Adhaeribacter soli]|uniref:DUF4239 domain-containing protein n=1 Tax=Adhaeribacter soli TaxID=2607655 RepID=A0A5N1IR41_9BACT|nr:hypothetical protein [Adhaeribacter soli]KAA9332625.1 hypothetical protein F0P94_11475 [Adhaeribacter soli]